MALSEFEIIQQVFQQQKIARRDVILGIGDDAAVTKIPAGHELVTTVDTLTAGIHFPVNMKPKDIGYRSLAVNLSDLAAMGAEPAWATLALTIPESNEAWLKAFASGFFGLAEEYNVQLTGGDTTRGNLSITVQLQGLIPEGQSLTRHGAKVNDLIFITGTLGDAAAGLDFWDRPEKSYKWLKQRLARPVPQVKPGIALRNLATSAIDISDGLIGDLKHILKASGVGARIKLESLPLSLALCDSLTLDKAREKALFGGDDYELCFTAAIEDKEEVEKLNHFCQIGRIGEIVADPGIHCFSRDGSEYELTNSGFQHFYGNSN